VIETSEQHIISEQCHRETKEEFIGSPLWKEDGPDAIGSVMTMKRQLYSNKTTYGRGKLISQSLNSTHQELDYFTLKIPQDFPLQNLDHIVKAVEQLPSITLGVAITNPKDSRIRVITHDYSEEGYMHLIYSALFAWLEFNNQTIEELCENNGLDEHILELEDFLEDPFDSDSWISFNLGFDLETIFSPSEN